MILATIICKEDLIPLLSEGYLYPNNPKGEQQGRQDKDLLGSVLATLPITRTQLLLR